MAEWSNAAVLKTVVPRGTGGSNPSLSAEQRRKPAQATVRVFSFWPEPSFLERRGRMEKHGSSAATTGIILCAEPSPLSGSRAQRVIPLSPHGYCTKVYQNAQNQRFGHFFCPNRCNKMHQNVPTLGCLAGCFFATPKKATQHC